MSDPSEPTDPGDDRSPLEARMESLGVAEEDLEEKFVLGTGPGGQKINKTSICVFLKHRPTGVHVKCQSGRSREANREMARVLLCDQIESGIEAERARTRQAREKERRRNRKPSARAKRRNLEQKRRRSTLKQHRGKPKENGD